jgi:hypothetical protein
MSAAEVGSRRATETMFFGAMLAIAAIAAAFEVGGNEVLQKFRRG